MARNVQLESVYERKTTVRGLDHPPGGRGTPSNDLYGEAPPERGTIFTLQVMARDFTKKGISFLPKMVYKRVRGRTSGRRLLVLVFFGTLSPGTIPYSMWRVFSHVIIFFDVSKRLRHTYPNMIVSLFQDSHVAFGSSINNINQRCFLFGGKHCKLANFLKYKFTHAILRARQGRCLCVIFPTPLGFLNLCYSSETSIKTNI